MDRKVFLSVAGAAPLAPVPGASPSIIGANDLRLLVTIGLESRIGVLAASSTFVVLWTRSRLSWTVNVPRPPLGEARWNVLPPPAVPFANPTRHYGDIVDSGGPDDVTASSRYRNGVVFAFKPRIEPAYLVYVVPGRLPMAVRALQRAGDVRALFAGTDGISVIFEAGVADQAIVPFPPE